jgi:large-conductance mechanosensitive channel
MLIIIIGGSYSKIVDTFKGSILIPLSTLIINLRYFIILTLNLHLLISS